MNTNIVRLLTRRRVHVVQSVSLAAFDKSLRVVLCDTEAAMTDAWLDSFYGVAGVEIVRGDLLAAGTDAVISPANSFGDMGGGVDKRIDDYSKGGAQAAVTAAIAEQFFGELPVGSAVVTCPIGSPIVVAAPTMRVPGDVSASLNAYLSMRAALVAVYRHNTITSRRIRSIAVPGLCTGVGRMPHAISASQMRAAYDSVVVGAWRDVKHPALAPFAFSIKGSEWDRSP